VRYRPALVFSREGLVDMVNLPGKKVLAVEAAETAVAMPTAMAGGLDAERMATEDNSRKNVLDLCYGASLRGILGVLGGLAGRLRGLAKDAGGLGRGC